MIDALGQAGPFGYLLVFVAAATPMVEILLVIPAGIAVGMAPVPVALVALAGNISTVAVVAVFGDRLLGRWRRRRAPVEAAEAGNPAGAGGSGLPCAPGDSGRSGGPGGANTAQPESGRSGRARRIVERYGIPGLAFLAPLITGTHLAVIAALAVGGRRGPVLAWMAAGLVVWAVAAATAAALGVQLLGGSP